MNFVCTECDCLVDDFCVVVESVICNDAGFLQFYCKACFKKRRKIKMKDKFCPICKYKVYSESKERPVMCECEWDEMEMKQMEKSN